MNPSLVLVQPRKACPFTTERLLMGRKESKDFFKILYHTNFKQCKSRIGTLGAIMIYYRQAYGYFNR